MDRFILFALEAAQQALEQSELETRVMMSGFERPQ